MRIGISNSGPGIGDQVVYTSLPENYFANTGEKLVDVNGAWVFKHNPFVERGVKPDRIVDLWGHRLSTKAFPSLAQRICESFGLKRTVLRHPRLYRFEDEPLEPNSVAVHTTGRSRGMMSGEVIEQIRRAYAGFRIIQLGSVTDCAAPFEDKRGLPLWDSIATLARCQTFIGVDSSLMNIANCYPRIRKKLIFTYDHEFLLPATHQMRWIDYGWEYYNPTAEDKGISLSYLKLRP